MHPVSERYSSSPKRSPQILWVVSGREKGQGTGRPEGSGDGVGAVLNRELRKGLPRRRPVDRGLKEADRVQAQGPLGKRAAWALAPFLGPEAIHPPRGGDPTGPGRLCLRW